MDLIFRNGTIASDGLEYTADLAVKDGRVAAIGDLGDGGGAETVDCEGLVLLPGAVDLGLNLLEEGDFDPESSAGFSLSTRDAAQGGVTTVVNTMELEEDEPAGETIRAQAGADGKKAFVDFGYHLLVSDWGDRRRQQALDALASGLASFWVARTDPPSDYPSPALLCALLDDLPKDSLILASPYDAAARYYLKKASAGDLASAEAWADALPASYGSSSICQAGKLASGRRPRILFRGLDGTDALEAFQMVRERCPNIYGSVALPSLLFPASMESPRTWPPVRGRPDLQALFAGLEDGLVSLVLSGHKPRSEAERLGHSAPGELPPVGVATLAHFLPLLHSEGVAKWRLSLATLSQCACADPAKLAGLYPRKGSLQIGSDADIVLLDPNGERSAKCAESSSAELQFADPLAQYPCRGTIHRVYLRGRPIWNDQEGINESPEGVFLERRLDLW